MLLKDDACGQALGVRCVTASGGVTCNSGLRSALGQDCKIKGYDLRLANPVLCTDNAAMVGMVAHMRLANGMTSTSLDRGSLRTGHLLK